MPVTKDNKEKKGEVGFLLSESLATFGTPESGGYKRFKSFILQGESETRNGSYYTRSFLDSVIARANEVGRNVGGWRGHWDHRRTTQKFIFLPETFYVEDDGLYGEGYLRVDEETKALIEDFQNGFHLPLSVTARVTEWVNDENGRPSKYTRGELLSVDLVGVPASEKAGIIEFIEEPKTEGVKNEAAAPPTNTKTKENVMHGNQKPQIITEEISSSRTEPSTPPVSPPTPDTTPVVASPANPAPVATESATASPPLTNIFAEDVKAAHAVEMDEFRKARAKQTYDGHRENVVRQAKEAFQPATVDALMTQFDQIASNLAEGLGIPVHSLTASQVESCALTARKITRQFIATHESGIRHQTRSKFNNNLLDGDCHLANAIVNSIAGSESTNIRMGIGTGVTWSEVLANEASRNLVVNSIRVDGKRMSGEMTAYASAVTAFNGLGTHQLYGLTDQSRHALSAVEGVHSDWDGPTLTQYVPAPSCVAVVIAALCLHTSELLRSMSRVKGDRFVYYTYEACHPETHAPVGTTFTIDMQASGQHVVTVPVSSGMTARHASYTNLAGDTIELAPMTDYLATAETGGTLKFMLVGNQHFEGQNSIDIDLLIGASTDPCGTSMLLKLKREERTVERQWASIGIPWCKEALQAVIEDTGVNLKTKALADAIYIVYRYFEDMILLKLQDAASECIIKKQMASPDMDLHQLIPVFNATSFSWNGSATDGTISELITISRRLSRRCVSGSASHIVMPEELLDLLSYWRHDVNLANIAGTVQSGNDATAKVLANMKIIPVAGAMNEETIIIDAATGETAKVLVGAVYILEGAIMGDWSRMAVETDGNIYKNVKYHCEDGSNSDMIVPTGLKVDRFKVQFHCDIMPAFVHVIQVVLPHIGGCGIGPKMPNYSLV